jgi:hypothetical protein
MSRTETRAGWFRDAPAAGPPRQLARRRHCRRSKGLVSFDAQLVAAQERRRRGGEATASGRGAARPLGPPAPAPACCELLRPRSQAWAGGRRRAQVEARVAVRRAAADGKHQVAFVCASPSKRAAWRRRRAQLTQARDRDSAARAALPELLLVVPDGTYEAARRRLSARAVAKLVKGRAEDFEAVSSTGTRTWCSACTPWATSTWSRARSRPR